jgi:hypothetical protein
MQKIVDEHKYLGNRGREKKTRRKKKRESHSAQYAQACRYTKGIA